MTGTGERINDEKRLRGAAGWQYRPKPAEWRLGEEIVSYLEHRGRTFAKNAALLDIWEEAVPEFLLNECRPGKRVGNTLYVEVTPGPFMHRMQVQCDEILEKIQDLCPRCGIQKIRLVPRLFEES
jgi:hypothetical protein